ncbi:hypothetical protein SPLC1_S205690 [Arthrospira platensis C1]|nr:hypothetical protein SPLC1_S205690 [Arthrospira platensis C1]
MSVHERSRSPSLRDSLPQISHIYDTMAIGNSQH